MSEVIKTVSHLCPEDIKTILAVGAKMEREKRQVKDIEGPFTGDKAQAWIVYTEDKEVYV